MVLYTINPTEVFFITHILTFVVISCGLGVVTAVGLQLTKPTTPLSVFDEIRGLETTLGNDNEHDHPTYKKAA